MKNKVLQEQLKAETLAQIRAGTFDLDALIARLTPLIRAELEPDIRAQLAAAVEKDLTPPPVDNAHVAPGCEPFTSSVPV